MRAFIGGLAILGLALVLGSGVFAGGKDEKTLKGTITCAKCDLKVEKACATVIVVKGKDNKEVTYYFTKESNKKYHGDICTEAKKGQVTGTVTKDGKKMVVNVKELKYE